MVARCVGVRPPKMKVGVRARSRIPSLILVPPPPARFATQAARAMVHRAIFFEILSSRAVLAGYLLVGETQPHRHTASRVRESRHHHTEKTAARGAADRGSGGPGGRGTATGARRGP